MKVCSVGRSNGRGGGYAAAYRLHHGLRKLGVDSSMLVGIDNRDDFTVLSPTSKLAQTWMKLAPGLDRMPTRFYPQRENLPYSVQWLPDRVTAEVAKIAPDIINLHWINSGYLQIESLPKLGKPIVWTLHDMWAFTGGCHYSRECDRYTKACGACPQLHSNRDWDLSRWIWRRKLKAWQDLNLTIVTPSNWLADCARKSSLLGGLRIEAIPNGLNAQRYQPIEKSLAKKLVGLPPDKKIILFGALQATSDRRKGFHLLMPALQKLSYLQDSERIELVVFGSSQPKKTPDFGFKVNYLGKLNDDISIALVYAAADVFVAPSLQDNLPNTIIEALACGTPCVGFNIGGLSDAIAHLETGYLAKPYEPEDLAWGISWVLEEELRWQDLSRQARAKVEQEFTVEIQARKYHQLFEEILNNSHAGKPQ
ncbi:glycosyltransferase family 4 protein [Myxosarcina sp. GI1]|uniref:glycosyltransferase family 4 protein n=1 Tax=Myxosarcina sp. GI1 TaxID=1541065 RepID=UPI000561CA4E|nr:glycosyltransferase family 4 protein [Myxosarcina sp. GI1]